MNEAEQKSQDDLLTAIKYDLSSHKTTVDEILNGQDTSPLGMVVMILHSLAITKNVNITDLPGAEIETLRNFSANKGEYNTGKENLLAHDLQKTCTEVVKHYNAHKVIDPLCDVITSFMRKYGETLRHIEDNLDIYGLKNQQELVKFPLSNVMATLEGLDTKFTLNSLHLKTSSSEIDYSYFKADRKAIESNLKDRNDRDILMDGVPECLQQISASLKSTNQYGELVKDLSEAYLDYVANVLPQMKSQMVSQTFLTTTSSIGAFQQNALNYRLGSAARGGSGQQGIP